MKDYNEMPQSIQVLIEDICKEDPYGLNPSTLYRNIVNTSDGLPDDTVARIYQISESLVNMIKENQNTS